MSTWSTCTWVTCGENWVTTRPKVGLFARSVAWVTGWEPENECPSATGKDREWKAVRFGSRGSAADRPGAGPGCRSTDDMDRGLRCGSDDLPRPPGASRRRPHRDR